MPPRALASLVTELVDYAGLFPPASRSMREAVASYLSYRDAPARWMLGRFVAPVSRLHELSGVLAGAADRVTPVRVAATGGADPRDDVSRLNAFNAQHGGAAVADVLEVKVASAADVRRAADAARGDVVLYAEVPLANDPATLLDAVRSAGVNAKVRTGGVTPEAFPAAPQLARFIARCAERGIRWKATAGLHHPLRAEHPLTYDADAPRGTMFGFLNVFAAGAFAFGGMPEGDVTHLLEERDPRAIVFDDSAMRWRDHVLSAAEVARARERFASSFGSCSFREPVDDLCRLGLLESLAP